MENYTICSPDGSVRLAVGETPEKLKKMYPNSLFFPYCKNWYGIPVDRNVHTKSWTIVVVENNNLKIYSYRGKDITFDTQRYEDFGRFKVLALFEGVKYAI